MPSGVLPSGAGGVIPVPRLGGGSNVAVAPRQFTGTQAQPSVQGPARAVQNQPRSADISAYGGNGSPKINDDPLGDDTGLGKETHSVISQGRVEEIVTSKPRERRLLIEEATDLTREIISRRDALIRRAKA